MKPDSKDINAVTQKFRTLNSTLLLARVRKVYGGLKDSGTDLRASCRHAAGSASCWIAWYLDPLNKVLWTISMQITEHAPGAFTLRSILKNDVEDKHPDSQYLDGAILVYYLLKRHLCITRLHLGEKAVLAVNFPSLLREALQDSKSHADVKDHRLSTDDSRQPTQGSALLPSSIAKQWHRFESLDIPHILMDETATANITDALRDGQLHHLVLSSLMAGATANKLFHAAGLSSNLTALEIAACQKFSRSNAILLAQALKQNKVLRKVTIGLLGDDVLGIILGCLQHNNTLQQLSLSTTFGPPQSGMWDGFQALGANKGLRYLKLENLALPNSVALVIADILHQNNTLQELCLSVNPIGDLGGCAVAKALEVNSSLQRLDMSYCKLTVEAMSSFAEALAKNSTLEYVRLDNVDVPPHWTPPSTLTANVYARLRVALNTSGLEHWTACLNNESYRFIRTYVGWTHSINSAAVANFFSNASSSFAVCTELVIDSRSVVEPECTSAFVAILESTNSLKKLGVEESGISFGFTIAVIRGLVRNKSVVEAAFLYTVSGQTELKALNALLRGNRTLQTLKFRSHSFGHNALLSLSRAIKDNFVLLSLEFTYGSGYFDMYPLVNALNRNRSLLSRAVDCVLNCSGDAESLRALRLLSTCESLLDAVSEASGKTHEESRLIILEAVNRLKAHT